MSENLPQPMAQPIEVTPMQMLQLAVQKGVDTEQLTKLMDLEERWRAGKAREAFVQAMTAFKAEPSSILKTKAVNIPGGPQYSHATLADVVDVACANLSKHGLSHRWEFAQAEGRVSVTCVLMHEGGHSERVTLSAPPDDSGKKNGVQAISSTVSYLERYTLLGVTGLAAKDMDDDGRAAEGGEDDMMAYAAQLTACKAMLALAKTMNSFPPAVQRLMLPTFQRLREELGRADPQ